MSIFLRKISKFEELQHFNERFLQVGGYKPLDMDWLGSSSVYVLRKQSAYVAGYVASSSTERTLAGIENEEEKRILLDSITKDHSRIIDISGLWIDRFKTSRAEKLAIWVDVFVRSAFTSKSYSICSGYTRQVNKIYKSFGFDLIYDAASPRNSKERYQIWLADRATILKSIKFMSKRIFSQPKRRSIKQKNS